MRSWVVEKDSSMVEIRRWNFWWLGRLLGDRWAWWKRREEGRGSCESAISENDQPPDVLMEFVLEVYETLIPVLVVVGLLVEWMDG